LPVSFNKAIDNKSNTSTASLLRKKYGISSEFSSNYIIEMLSDLSLSSIAAVKAIEFIKK